MFIIHSSRTPLPTPTPYAQPRHRVSSPNWLPPFEPSIATIASRHPLRAFEEAAAGDREKKRARETTKLAKNIRCAVPAYVSLCASGVVISLMYLAAVVVVVVVSSSW